VLAQHPCLKKPSMSLAVAMKIKRMGKRGNCEVWSYVLTSSLDIILLDFEFVSTEILLQPRLAGSMGRLRKIY
jgi:hypothetical protein